MFFQHKRSRSAASEYSRLSIPIFLDCDPGHDDAIALLLALASPEVELLGVTTVHGNQTLDKTTENALRVLELVGRSDVPVARGADRPLLRELARRRARARRERPRRPGAARGDRAARRRAGVDFIAATDPRRAPCLVADGPLTNIALYLEAHGTANVERIVLMGGAIAEGNMTPAAEFNIWADPEAAHRVFRLRPPVTMIGLDVTHKALLTPAWASASAPRGGRHLRRGARRVLQALPRARPTAGTAPRSTTPSRWRTSSARARRDRAPQRRDRDRTSELCRGRTVVDLWRRTEREPNADVGVDIDGDAFFELLLERIAGLADAAWPARARDRSRARSHSPSGSSRS